MLEEPTHTITNQIGLSKSWLTIIIAPGLLADKNSRGDVKKIISVFAMSMTIE